ncbi:MAG: hypothetical protein HEEMFOPI_00541 [Holosporales bacterium]
MVYFLAPLSYIQELLVYQSHVLTLSDIDFLACFLNIKSKQKAALFLNIDQKNFEKKLAYIKTIFTVRTNKDLINVFEQNQKNKLFKFYYQYLCLEKRFKDAFKNYRSPLGYDEYSLSYLEGDFFSKICVLFIKRYFDFFNIPIKTKTFLKNTTTKNNIFLVLEKTNPAESHCASYLIFIKANALNKKKIMFFFDAKSDFFKVLLNIINEILKDQNLVSLYRDFEKKHKANILNHGIKQKYSVLGFLNYLIGKNKYKTKKTMSFNRFIISLVVAFLFLYTLFDFSQKNHMQDVFSLKNISPTIQKIFINDQICEIDEDEKLYPKNNLLNTILHKRL